MPCGCSRKLHGIRPRLTGSLEGRVSPKDGAENVVGVAERPAIKLPRGLHYRNVPFSGCSLSL